MITIEDLKERWFNAYPEVMGISGDKPIQCYGKKDVDECLAGIEAVPHTDNSAVIDRLNREQANAANRLRDSMEKAIRRQKYRRCLRIISTCENKMADAFLPSPEYLSWLIKWRDRWVRIANEFKEPKE